MNVPLMQRVGIAVLAFVLSVLIAGTLGYLIAGWLP